MSLASFTSSSVVSAASGVVCESSCAIAYKTNFRGSLSSAIHASESFIILLDCALSKADKLLAAAHSSATFALDCSFFDARAGVDAHSGSSLFLSQCSLVNMKESAVGAAGCCVTLHNCRISGIAHCALHVMGGALVLAAGCYFDQCRSTAHAAALPAADLEAFYKFLWRWKRSSSKEKHAAVSLELATLPCKLVLDFDKPQKVCVHVLHGGAVECNVSVERCELSAEDGAPVLLPGGEEFVREELDRLRLAQDKVLERVVCMMGLNSLRSSFDKWSLATAAAVNERTLAEEAAKKRAELEAQLNSETDDDVAEEEAQSEVADALELSASAVPRQRAPFGKRKLRAEMKHRQQVMAAMAVACPCDCYV